MLQQCCRFPFCRMRACALRAPPDFRRVVAVTVSGLCRAPAVTVRGLCREQQVVVSQQDQPVGGCQDFKEEETCEKEEKKPTWKWRLVISYDGTNYSGWQYQPHFSTVQGMIEDALTKLTRFSRDELVMVGAGRTDAGAHAAGQVAHFWTPSCIEDLNRIHRGLNGILPYDIRVSEVSAVQTEFHAQFSALTKKYQYKVCMAPVMDPFQRLYAYHMTTKLDVPAMVEACSYFVGEHDFTTFSNCSKESMHRLQRNPFRNILQFSLVEQGSMLLFDVEGTGFFYKQVRNMVGLVITIGKGGHAPTIVQELLASRDRRKLATVSYTAPSRGLTLVSVSYDEKDLALPEGAPVACFGSFRDVCKDQVEISTDLES